MSSVRIGIRNDPREFDYTVDLSDWGGVYISETEYNDILRVLDEYDRVQDLLYKLYREQSNDVYVMNSLGFTVHNRPKIAPCSAHALEGQDAEST